MIRLQYIHPRVLNYTIIYWFISCPPFPPCSVRSMWSMPKCSRWRLSSISKSRPSGTEGSSVPWKWSADWPWWLFPIVRAFKLQTNHNRIKKKSLHFRQSKECRQHHTLITDAARSLLPLHGQRSLWAMRPCTSLHIHAWRTARRLVPGEEEEDY